MDTNGTKISLNELEARPILPSDMTAIEPVVLAPRQDSMSAKRPSGSFILHPLSGLLILVLDYTCFGGEVVTVGLGLLLTCLMAFVLAGTGIFLVQRMIEEEPFGKALAKAFVGGLVTGAPTPIFGTIFGTLILGVSGLNLLGRLWPRRQ